MLINVKQIFTIFNIPCRRYLSFSRNFSFHRTTYTVRFSLSDIYKGRTKPIRLLTSMTVPNVHKKYAIWLCDVSKYRCYALEN